MTPPNARAELQMLTGVSRETMSCLDQFEGLLRKWAPTINLVARSSLDKLWQRHFLDSAQVFAVANPTSGTWADLGSGGGFPGLVISILARELAPGLRVSLVEADQRKAAFLATVVRECKLTTSVIAERIELAAPISAQFLSARALAPLPKLLGFAERHLAQGGSAFLSKGDNWRAEISAARKLWRFDAITYPSKTDKSATIIELKGLARA